MPFYRYTAPWSIPNAGPSVTTLHATPVNTFSAQAWADGVRAMFVALAPRFPNEVTVNFATEVTQHEDTTGALIGSFPVTPGAAVPGTDTGLWAGGTGIRIVWGTGAIRDGRRVRGTTFLVPTVAATFNNAGQVTPAAQGQIQTAAANYVQNGLTAGYGPVVWSRPAPGRPGAWSLVSTVTVPQVAATLRTRKY